MEATIRLDGVRYDVALEAQDDGSWLATVDDETFRVARAGHIVHAGGASHEVRVHDDDVSVDGARRDVQFDAVAGVAGQSAGAGTDGRVHPPMNGTIADVCVEVGATVEQGSVLFVLEAMKMRNEVKAPRAGAIAAINIAPGAAVAPGMVAVEIVDA